MAEPHSTAESREKLQKFNATLGQRLTERTAAPIEVASSIISLCGSAIWVLTEQAMCHRESARCPRALQAKQANL